MTCQSFQHNNVTRHPPYEKEISGKCHRKCPCGSENIWKMSGKMVKFTVRNFLCAEKIGQILDMKEFWTNSG
jgi:hypothetical protein